MKNFEKWKKTLAVSDRIEFTNFLGIKVMREGDDEVSVLWRYCKSFNSIHQENYLGCIQKSV
jgi:hypothetical protein